MVKVDDSTADGNAWYWYEVFSTTDGSNPLEGRDFSLCTGCHSLGSDFIRVPFPLQ